MKIHAVLLPLDSAASLELIHALQCIRDNIEEVQVTILPAAFTPPVKCFDWSLARYNEECLREWLIELRDRLSSSALIAVTSLQANAFSHLTRNGCLRQLDNNILIVNLACSEGAEGVCGLMLHAIYKSVGLSGDCSNKCVGNLEHARKGVTKLCDTCRAMLKHKIDARL